MGVNTADPLSSRPMPCKVLNAPISYRWVISPGGLIDEITIWLYREPCLQEARCHQVDTIGARIQENQKPNAARAPTVVAQAEAASCATSANSLKCFLRTPIIYFFNAGSCEVTRTNNGM